MEISSLLDGEIQCALIQEPGITVATERPLASCVIKKYFHNIKGETWPPCRVLRLKFCIRMPTD